jgi:DNA polymerase I
MRLVFDIETNHLELDKITTIHCICAYDLESGNSWSFYDYPDMSGNNRPIKMGIAYLRHASEIIGHNIIAYDIPVIRKFYPEFKPKKATDTLVLSRLMNPDRPQGHSLKSYGDDEIQKVEHEDWTVFSPEMLKRCEVDVQLNARLYSQFEERLEKDHKGHWSKAIPLEHKVAHIMYQQARNGWYFDTDKANALVARLNNDIAEIDEELKEYLKPKPVKISEVKKPFNKDGNFSAHAHKYLSNHWECPNGMVIHVIGSFSVIKFEPINLGSEKQMKILLLSLGWQPTQWNYKKDEKGKLIKDKAGSLIKTSPKLTEDSYDSLPEGLGQTLARRLKCGHRKSFIEGLLEAVRPDHRIPAEANPCATNTARMAHKIVVNVPKAEPKVFLGKECRELFTAPQGRILVGCDAKSLEARCLAHYVNDPVFTREILETDIHTVMQQLSGLETRHQAKGLTYGIIYGAGDAKIGQIINGTAKQGAELRAQLYARCPNLGKLIEDTKKAAKKGWLVGIDGRKLLVRNEYSALNVRLQGCGAITMKVAVWQSYIVIKKLKLDAMQVGHHHDEMTWECNPNNADEVASILKNSIIKAGEILNLRCPLDGDPKIGKNWAEIH